MVLECTSCGSQILTTVRSYKCRQCVNHVVCVVCFRKEHNRASNAHHTMSKVDPPSKASKSSSAATPPLPPTVGPEVPVTAVGPPGPSSVPSTTSSSTTASAYSSLMKYKGSTAAPKPKESSAIFTSRDYLTQFLGFCHHCLKVIVGGKDDFFTCDQCIGDTFDVCKQCLPLMQSKHSSVHTFSKKVRSSDLSQLAGKLSHLNTKCGSCASQDITGVRYRSKKSSNESDLCEHCAEKSKKQQQPLKIIPHPFLLANNKFLLARRAIKFIDQSSHARDPLTGWTRPYAETIVEKSTREQVTFRKQLTSVLSTREETPSVVVDADWQATKRSLELLRDLIDQQITLHSLRFPAIVLH